MHAATTTVISVTPKPPPAAKLAIIAVDGVDAVVVVTMVTVVFVIVPYDGNGGGRSTSIIVMLAFCKTTWDINLSNN